MLDAPGESLDRLSLALLHLVHVHAHAALHDNAVIGKVLLHIVVVMAGLQQRLRRDAPDVEAGSAEGAAHLDAGGGKPELGGLDGGDVSTRSASDDDHVVLLRSGGRGGEGAGGAGEEGGGRIWRIGAEGGSRAGGSGQGGAGEHDWIIYVKMDSNIKHYFQEDVVPSEFVQRARTEGKEAPARIFFG